jgi:hypothetical protein
MAEFQTVNPERYFGRDKGGEDFPKFVDGLFTKCIEGNVGITVEFFIVVILRDGSRWGGFFFVVGTDFAMSGKRATHS